MPDKGKEKAKTSNEAPNTNAVGEADFNALAIQAETYLYDFYSFLEAGISQGPRFVELPNEMVNNFQALAAQIQPHLEKLRQRPGFATIQAFLDAVPGNAEYDDADESDYEETSSEAVLAPGSSASTGPASSSKSGPST
jgi:hypothetical protein